jgi:gas vesicle protein GvpL/GvpF
VTTQATSLSGRVTYVYAVARQFHPVHLWGVRGVHGAAVHTVRYRDVVAVVSTLPDVDETTPCASEDGSMLRAHHAVVDTIAARTATLPVRPATLCASERHVTELLREISPSLDVVLEPTEG